MEYFHPENTGKSGRKSEYNIIEEKRRK